jgi:hypothetical protein
LPRKDGSSQTSYDILRQIDIHNNIPKWVVNKQGTAQLYQLSTMRIFHDKSLEIDNVRRNRMIKAIRLEVLEGVWTEEEEAILVQNSKFFALFEDDSAAKSKTITARSPLARAKLAWEKGDK